LGCESFPGTVDDPYESLDLDPEDDGFARGEAAAEEYEGRFRSPPLTWLGEELADSGRFFDPDPVGVMMLLLLLLLILILLCFGEAFALDARGLMSGTFRVRDGDTARPLTTGTAGGEDIDWRSASMPGETMELEPLLLASVALPVFSPATPLLLPDVEDEEGDGVAVLPSRWRSSVAPPLALWPSSAGGVPAFPTLVIEPDETSTSMSTSAVDDPSSGFFLSEFCFVSMVAMLVQAQKIKLNDNPRVRVLEKRTYRYPTG
jgi:hypothetical protein